MARVALAMAVLSARVGAEIVAADAFDGLARDSGITSVPTAVVNDSWSVVGAPPETTLVSRLTSRSRPAD